MIPVYIDGRTPQKSYRDDAAFDLRSTVISIVPAGSRAIIPCGFSIAIPNGYVGLVCSRSGLANGRSVFVLNAPGVIDPGYRGEVKVVLMNLSNIDFHIDIGDRIAQLLIVPTADVVLVKSATQIATIFPSERGEGGFGSTGVGGAK